MLSIEQIQQKEIELKSYIEELASKSMNEEEQEAFIYKLGVFYLQDFRHSYSKFFPIITELGNNLEYLSNNLSELKMRIGNHYQENPKKYLYLYKRFLKLSDHLNLEIGRYQYFSEKEQRTKELEQKIISINEDLIKTKTESQDAKNQLEVATHKLETVQSELITVLSIFAAIVMTFSGSMHLLGSALTGLSNITVLESILFVLLCGFVLFNLIFLMMYFIAKITGRNIYARCETPNCTCKDNKVPKCNGIIRIYKRLPYVFWLNTVIIILVAVDLTIMFFRGMM